MAYRIIDDETALTIFEAIQQTSTRSFARYDCLRQLPRHKINGELLFYLDELIDFAEKELELSATEALGQVLDMGLTAWFAGLDPALQQKLGFTVNGAAQLSPKADGTASPAAPTTDADLSAEILRLTEALEAAAAEKVALKREIAHLEQVNEELADQQPQALSQPQNQQAAASGGGGYMDNGAFSGYMALTSHSLTGSSHSGGDSKKSSAPKKNKRRRKKRPAGTAPNGRPQ